MLELGPHAASFRPLALDERAVGAGIARPLGQIRVELGELSVRRSAFDAHLEALRSRGLEGAEQPAVLRGVLDAFLEERVLVLEARRRGLLSADATPEQE